MIDKICEIQNEVKNQKPILHCITNPISINQCANVILSVGARPIMAEHPMEVDEITLSSDALMLNTGNITDARMESMVISAKTATDKKIPFLLDVVGIACSKFRRNYISDFLSRFVPSVIKGNYSEIKALHDAQYFSPGVDADPTVDIENITKAATELAAKYKTVILATGKTDIITDGKNCVYVNNGTQELASVTGTGCMLGALCAVFMTSAIPLDACIAACHYFGICGELSKTDNGNGGFTVNLIDKISKLGREEISMYLKTEEKLN